MSTVRPEHQTLGPIVVGSASEYDNNLEDFCCLSCQLSIRCRYGKLEFEKVGYKKGCYYMRNPFEPPDIHKAHKDYSIDDFVVVGSRCFICEQQTCIDEECSIFYKNAYCLKCVWRDRHNFPDELVAQVSKQRKKEKQETT